MATVLARTVFFSAGLASLWCAETPPTDSLPLVSLGIVLVALALALMFGALSRAPAPEGAAPVAARSAYALAASGLMLFELAALHPVLERLHEPKGILRTGPGIIRFVYTILKWWTVLAHVATWRLAAVADAAATSKALLVVFGAKYAFAVLAMTVPKFVNAFSTIFALWGLVQLVRLGAADWLMGVAALAAAGGVGAAVSAVTGAAARLAEVFALYALGCGYAALAAAGAAGLGLADGAVSAWGRGVWGSDSTGLAVLLAFTRPIAWSVASGCAALALVHLALTSALTGLTCVFAPAFVREVGEQSAEYPFLQRAVRARHLGFTMLFLVVFVQPFGSLEHVLAHVPIMVLYFALDAMYVLAEVAANVLLCISSQSTSRWEHARALVFFAAVVALDVAVLVWFLRAAGGFNYAVFYFLDAWTRGFVRLAKNFALYAIQQWSAPERVDDRVYWTEFSANALDVTLKLVVIAGSIWQRQGDQSMWLLIYAVSTVKGIQASWRSFEARRAAAARFDESVRNASAAEVAGLADDVCAFCYEPFGAGVKRLACGHFFHELCIRRWLAVQNSCPQCRARVLPE